MATDVNFLITAKDDASSTFGRVKAGLTGLQGAAQGLHTTFMQPLKMAGIDNVMTKLGAMRNTMASMPVGGTLLAAGGVAAATTGLIQNSVAAHNAMGAIQDLSDKYKVSTEALQVFGEMGADVGVDTGSIAKGFSKLQIKIAEAMQGSKEAVQGFADVGVTPKDLEGGAVEVFKKISDLYKSKDFAGADPFKIASAKNLLGKAGAELIPVLEQGGDKYADILKMMQAEGRLFSSDTIKQADTVGDAWGASMRRIDGLKKTIGIAMGTALTAISEGINKLLDSPAKGEMIAVFAKLGENIAKEAPKFIAKLPAIVQGFSAVFGAIQKIADLIGWDTIIGKVIFMLASPFIAATISSTLAIFRLTMAVGGFIGKMAVMAGGALMGGIRSLMLLQVSFMQVGLSATAAWVAAIAPIALVAAAVAGLAYLIYANWGGIKAFLGGVWDGFLIGIAPVAQAMEPVFDLVAQGWQWFKDLFGVTNDSAKGFEGWAAAGKLAGDYIAGIFKVMLLPIMLVIDAIKLVNAGINALSGGGFKMPEFSTAKLLQDPIAMKQPHDNFSRDTAAYFAPLERQSPQNYELGKNKFIGQYGQAAFDSYAQTVKPQYAQQSVEGQRAKFDGTLKVEIDSRGRAVVKELQTSEGFDITTRAGAMMGA